VSPASATELSTTIRTLARLGRLLENSPTEISITQYRLLALVDADVERASVLAGRLALSKPTITAAVDGLVERGLVVRGEVSGDRRATSIRLTPNGKKALRTAEAEMSARLDPILDRCDDRDAVLAAIDQVGRALDQAVAARLSKSSTN
jgi:long-chain acyl-CoA synthetase